MKSLRTRIRSLNDSLTKKAPLLGAYAAVAALVTLPLILLGSIVTFIQLRDAFAKPKIGLGFYRAQAPQFRVVNLGSTVVRDPKYQLEIHDLDVKADGKPFMLLLIPIRVLDYLNPTDGHGPYGIVSLSPRRDAVKDGHHLFGYAQVTCPGCNPSFRHYWFYAEVGKLGWYAEIPAKENATIGKRLAAILYSQNPLVAIDATIPRTLRVSISEPPGN
jgi:hypothetical protein